MRDSLKRLDNVVYIVDLAEFLGRRAIRCAIAGDLKLAISIASLGLSHCPRSSKYYASCAATVADMYYDIFQVTCGFPLAKHAPKHLWSPEEHDELCLVAISPVKDLKILGNYLDSKDSSDDEVLPDGIGIRDQPSEPVQWSGTEWKVLQRAVVIYGLAIATTDSEQEKYQAKLADVLIHRFDHLESGNDLLEAAKLLISFVDARTGSENAQGKALERLFKTARALGLQYDTFGDVKALESSISLFRRSLKMATKTSDTIRASLGLSAVLSSHFRLFQDRESQKESIDLLYSALDQTPQSIDQRWSIRARVAVALYHRCLNTDDLNGLASSLREAWETYVVNLNHSQQKEVEWIIWTIGAQAYAYYDPAKCGAYHDDFSIVEMARPLEEPGDTVPLCGPVYPFANAWRRFENVGNLGGASQDLNDAIQFGTEALQIVPKDAPHRPRLLHQLATFHADSFHTHRSSNSILGYDESKALEFLDEAEITSLNTHDRICVRRSKMKLLGQLGRWNDAVMVAEAAIEYISVLARENVQFKDRLRKLRSVHGLAANACYLSVQAKRSPFQSLRVLEMGRGLHLSVIMTHHGVASKDSACGNLDSISGRTSIQCSSSSLKDQHEHEGKAGHDIPLFGTHQSGLGASPVLGLPSEYMKTLKKAKDLKTIAGAGVIIIVNVPKIGDQSTAFVVDNAAIQCCELPEFTRGKVWHWARFMTGELRENMESEPGVMNRQLRELLTWLWTSLVEPLFRTSVFERKFRSQALPRVWWIASGPVSYLPLHAARLSDGDPSCDALDRIISSYVPTIKALAVLRKRELNISKLQMSKLLFIGMPRTPGSRDITGITQEIEAVKHVDPLRLAVEVRNAPTRDSLLGDIATFNIVHCACHGHSSSEDPLKSGLRIFAAGKSGHKTEATASLTVEDLMLLQGKKCDLAFLSACNTADNPDTFLADECIHMASAFQIAGFSHVVSTMWPCSDHGCVAIVKSFYAN